MTTAAYLSDEYYGPLRDEAEDNRPLKSMLVRELKPGKMGYVTAEDMYIDCNRRCYLRAYAHICESLQEDGDIHVSRTHDGDYHVMLWTWAHRFYPSPQAGPRNPDDIPVAKVR